MPNYRGAWNRLRRGAMPGGRYICRLVTATARRALLSTESLLLARFGKHSGSVVFGDIHRRAKGVV